MKDRVVTLILLVALFIAFGTVGRMEVDNIKYQTEVCEYEQVQY